MPRDTHLRDQRGGAGALDFEQYWGKALGSDPPDPLHALMGVHLVWIPAKRFQHRAVDLNWVNITCGALVGSYDLPPGGCKLRRCHPAHLCLLTASTL
ncbi:hypothetical protein EYF80_019408 [Liparis tanakae]|uniref:Uncharacterized protein n=1 Tax=Liparis tanakae TaxID=230148 RepID=A0A4Z2HZK4_9TELE|nr:hypothetical protein EYF80_019408 [Liparis tanakae]